MDKIDIFRNAVVLSDEDGNSLEVNIIDFRKEINAGSPREKEQGEGASRGKDRRGKKNHPFFHRKPPLSKWRGI